MHVAGVSHCYLYGTGGEGPPVASIIRVRVLANYPKLWYESHTYNEWQESARHRLVAGGVPALHKGKCIPTVRHRTRSLWDILHRTLGVVRIVIATHSE